MEERDRVSHYICTGNEIFSNLNPYPKSESQPLPMCVFISRSLSQSNHTLVLSQSSRTAFFLPSFLGTNSTSNGSDPSNNPP